MHADQPTGDDTLQRRPFAERIASVIASQKDRSPLVISINGAWGEGKSTVFGFLMEALKREQVVCVTFNPWRYSHEDDLLRAFFVALAESLDDPLLTKGEKLNEWAKEHLGWLGKAATLIPGASDATEGVLSQADRWLTPTIENLRERIQKKLRENEKRVAILLDDPDRLDDADLFSLFRLVKLTADFDYATFVLAMDYDAVAKAIGKRFGGEDQGRRFLEKIVQVPIRLPAIPRGKLKEFTLALLQEDLEGSVCVYG